MADWLDDLYDSPGSNDVNLIERKQEVISAIVSEFDAFGKSNVRLRWIIEEKLKIEGYVYSSDLLEVYYALLETGDYDGTLIKYKGMSDVLIRRKPWHERNRLLFGFINSTVGQLASLLVAFILGLFFGQSCNR